MFQEVFAALNARYMEELVAAPVGDLTASSAHAKIKSLAQIQSDISSISEDEKFISAKHRKEMGV